MLDYLEQIGHAGNSVWYHSFTLTQACVCLWLQIATNTQGETRFWVFSSCWAFRLESAAAVERRFSSRKPPLQPLYRYADQSSTDRRKEQNVWHAFVHTLPGCSVESDKVANLCHLHLHDWLHLPIPRSKQTRCILFQLVSRCWWLSCVFYMSVSDFSGYTSYLRPQRSCWTLSSLQHPWTTRSCKITGRWSCLF